MRERPPETAAGIVPVSRALSVELSVSFSVREDLSCERSGNHFCETRTHTHAHTTNRGLFGVGCWGAHTKKSLSFACTTLTRASNAQATRKHEISFCLQPLHVRACPPHADRYPRAHANAHARAHADGHARADADADADADGRRPCSCHCASTAGASLARPLPLPRRWPASCPCLALSLALSVSVSVGGENLLL